jgi:hypothetical protein
MTGAIFALENRMPSGVHRSRWKSAVRLTAFAHFNAFHLWHPPPIEEAYRLRAELMPKLRDPVDMQTLAWIWDRVAQTSVDGKDVTVRLGSEFQRCFAPETISDLAGGAVPGD